MTRLPRNLTGKELITALERLGYRETRQSGSHIRLSCEGAIPHHITVPNHDPLRVGTLASILADVAHHQGMTRDELIARILE